MKITGKILNGSSFVRIAKDLRDNGFHAGDEIYATAYGLNVSKETKALKCPPVLGVLSCTHYKSVPIDKNPDKIEYFIPYGKRGDLCYSKAVLVESRQYATTKAEAIEIYNDAVKMTADMFEKLKNDTLSDMI